MNKILYTLIFILSLSILPMYLQASGRPSNRDLLLALFQEKEVEEKQTKKN